jgi:DNA-binding CsgD family transcriptional regulator
MPRPEIAFPDHQAELRHGLNVLVEAGLTIEQIEKIRDKVGNGPGKIPYNKELIGMRRFMVQELLSANLSNSQIARVLKLSKETVNADRQQNRSLWSESILKTQDVHRARILQEAIQLKEQALMNFETSKKKRVTTVSDKGESVTITESAGESSFLTVAKGCLEQQAKVLGLYDIKPQMEEKKSYKGFLDDLAKTISDVKEKEANAKAINVDFTVEDEPPESNASTLFGPVEV